MAHRRPNSVADLQRKKLDGRVIARNSIKWFKTDPTQFTMSGFLGGLFKKLLTHKWGVSEEPPASSIVFSIIFLTPLMNPEHINEGGTFTSEVTKNTFWNYTVNLSGNGILVFTEPPTTQWEHLSWGLKPPSVLLLHNIISFLERGMRHLFMETNLDNNSVSV